ncbi:hypothetical protein R5R35_005847 [Gryllus longicercus]|uniref:Uncharacterized protein n=1 Tax=Gryllus longicercus TaxID=2509291 RepID=A0AAN9VZR0_9ORTH
MAELATQRNTLPSESRRDSKRTNVRDPRRGRAVATTDGQSQRGEATRRIVFSTEHVASTPQDSGLFRTFFVQSFGWTGLEKFLFCFHHTHSDRSQKMDHRLTTCGYSPGRTFVFSA